MGKTFTTIASRYSLGLGAGLLIAALFYLQGGEILIQSLESKTVEGDPVFNRIRFFPGWNQDVWMMNQSHHGLEADAKSWDRLVIVVDKSGPTKTARFLQLPPGELTWEKQLLQQSQSFRVSCFLCHSNGPRAIRPEPKFEQIGSLDQVKIQLWNLRIKTYGRVLENPEHTLTDPNLKTPFRYQGENENFELRKTVCSRCHNEQGWGGRGFLTRQNFLAIEFMLQNKFMPPPGFTVSADDEKDLNEFLKGI